MFAGIRLSQCVGKQLSVNCYEQVAASTCARTAQMTSLALWHSRLARRAEQARCPARELFSMHAVCEELALGRLDDLLADFLLGQTFLSNSCLHLFRIAGFDG